MILLIVKENYQLSLLRVDFGWINNNIKFSLKLVQIEITSTLPSVGWMWISICTRFNSNLILLFIHPYPPSKGWVNSYSILSLGDFTFLFILIVMKYLEKISIIVEFSQGLNSFINMKRYCCWWGSWHCQLRVRKNIHWGLARHFDM